MLEVGEHSIKDTVRSAIDRNHNVEYGAPRQVRSMRWSLDLDGPLGAFKVAVMRLKAQLTRKDTVKVIWAPSASIANMLGDP